MADWLLDLVSLLRCSKPPVLITAHDKHERYELSSASTLQTLQLEKQGYLRDVTSDFLAKATPPVDLR
jgi:hypothetical protein